MLELRLVAQPFLGGLMPKLRVKRHAVTQPLDPSYRLIALTQGQNTMVDTADYEWLDQFNWHASWDTRLHAFYAKRWDWDSGKAISMAREILQCEPGEEADHRNRNTLDNRRENLRKATRSQNTTNRKTQSNNTSGFKGVSWNKRDGKWVAYITHERIRLSLGYFSSKKEAIQSRNEAAKKLHGRFSVINDQK